MTGAILGLISILALSLIVGALSFIVWRFYPNRVLRWLPAAFSLLYYALNVHVPAPSIVALQKHTVYPLGDGLRVLSLAPAIGIGAFLLVLLFLRERAKRVRP